jgi:hypothetical protein
MRHWDHYNHQTVDFYLGFSTKGTAECKYTQNAT